MSTPRSVTTRTHLLPSHHRSTSSLSFPLAVIAGLNPKRHRNRTATFALPRPALVYPARLAAVSLVRRDTAAAEQIPLAPPPLHLVAKKHFPGQAPRDNVIPSSVDPARPIDPELVLDFDLRSPRAMREVEARRRGRVGAEPRAALYSPASRELKAILSDLNLRPPPLVIDVDTREDVEVLAPLLARLTASPQLPVLLIGGVPIGTSIEDIRALLASGELQRLVSSAGAVVGGGKKRKHKKS
ncbi:hypothetical protein C8J57DRAFT_1499666 [Mycena rebaudengoi]|nr:hypothetical protein C8J57DRAFT_1499666 [Mycena rebaudengoi]